MSALHIRAYLQYFYSPLFCYILVRTYYYDPYGNSLNKSETVSNPWQYASGYYDATTGLYKFGTRYYDPQTGRWPQKDPKPSANPYVYAGDEPTMQVDPSGRDAYNCTLAILAVEVFVFGAIFTLLVAFVADPPLVGAALYVALGGAGVLYIGAIVEALRSQGSGACNDVDVNGILSVLLPSL